MGTVDLVTGPPPADALAAIGAIDGVRYSQTVLAAQDGPEHRLGPESAGAILLLQGTFADRGRFEEFWGSAVELMALLAEAPGFIRRYNFADGPHYTLIAWWRTVEDALTFFHRPEHQAAMRGTFERRWNYTHFAGLWQVTAQHRRIFFCQACSDGVMSSGESRCTSCGAGFADPFLGPLPDALPGALPGTQPGTQPGTLPDTLPGRSTTTGDADVARAGIS